MNGAGFLGTGGTFGADVTLVVELVMGAALLVGMVLARRRHYRAHAFCQGSVVLLNPVLIASVMLPTFTRDVSPELPAGLRQAYYLFPFVHALLGTVAQLLGLYVVIRASTDWLPASLRFQNYKRWMRTTLALWWAVILLGLAAYWVMS